AERGGVAPVPLPWPDPARSTPIQPCFPRRSLRRRAGQCTGASVRAPPSPYLQAGGHWFEPSTAHYPKAPANERLAWSPQASDRPSRRLVGTGPHGAEDAVVQALGALVGRSRLPLTLSCP